MPPVLTPILESAAGDLKPFGALRTFHDDCTEIESYRELCGRGEGDDPAPEKSLERFDSDAGRTVFDSR